MAPETAPTTKAVLFCPRCSHAAPPDGDWDVTDQCYACPVCGAFVTDRTPPDSRASADVPCHA